MIILFIQNSAPFQNATVECIYVTQLTARMHNSSEMQHMKFTKTSKQTNKWTEK